jgi:HlyD family secretion protein
VEVPAPREGRLESVLATEGQRVERGALLAILDDRVAAIDARSAESTLEAAAGRGRAAMVRLDAAAAALERVKRLRERELASDSELESALAEEGRARADLATARAERSKAGTGMRSATLAVSLTRVEAPASGIVLKAPRATGGAVSPELEPLFVIGSELGSLRIDAEVSESEVGNLEPGGEATFIVPAYPKRTFTARVERVGIDARRDAAAVKYPVELRAGNASGLLRPAMTATVTIPVASAENVLVARDAALRFRPEGEPEAKVRTRVYRVTPDGLVEVPVSTGLSDGSFTQIIPQSPLPVGTPLAIGPSTNARQAGDGPGISLGNR